MRPDFWRQFFEGVLLALALQGVIVLIVHFAGL